MKTVIAAAATALSLAACATTGEDNTGEPPSGFDASATEFVGWVRITGEEFRLYGTEVRLRQGGQNCVSGALPRNAQRAASDLNGQRVRFFGTTAAWEERGAGPTFDWQGSAITNTCRKRVVILADRVEVIR